MAWKRAATLSKETKKKVEKVPTTKTELDDEVYGSLDPSFTLLLHGLESDFIEEQMDDDEAFNEEFLQLDRKS